MALSEAETLALINAGTAVAGSIFAAIANAIASGSSSNAQQLLQKLQALQADVDLAVAQRQASVDQDKRDAQDDIDRQAGTEKAPVPEPPKP